MNIFQVLSFDERIIVASAADTYNVVTWNQSLTLQRWFVNESTGQMLEVDIRVLQDTPESFNEAKKAALRWLNESEE